MLIVYPSISPLLILDLPYRRLTFQSVKVIITSGFISKLNTFFKEIKTMIVALPQNCKPSCKPFTIAIKTGFPESVFLFCLFTLKTSTDLDKYLKKSHFSLLSWYF